MNRKDYFALEIAELMSKGYQRRGFSFSVDHRVDEVYQFLKQHWDEKKIFLVTNNTARRVESMDLKDIDAETLLLICNEGERCGSICEEPRSDRRLSMIYEIRHDHIIIDVFDGKIPHNAPDPDAAFMRCMVGSIVIMGNAMEMTTNTSLEIMLNHEAYMSSPKIDKMYLKEIRRCVNELSRTKIDKSLPVEQALNENPDAFPFLRSRYMIYAVKKRLLADALKMFIFVHCAEVKDAQYISEDTEGSRGGAGEKMDYYLVDSLWDQRVDVINPFKVSGHFRKQPCGEGRKERKLIYIDSYMKHGYNRRAGKEIMESESIKDN